MLKRKMNQSVFTLHYLVADASPREIISLAGERAIEITPESARTTGQRREEKKNAI